MKKSARCKIRAHTDLTLLSFETEDPRSNPDWVFKSIRTAQVKVASQA